MSNNTNSKMVVPGAKQAIDKMKYGAQAAIDNMKAEIASELGVTLGADTSARQNGSVGGEITKRLVRLGQNQISGSNYQNK